MLRRLNIVVAGVIAAWLMCYAALASEFPRLPQAISASELARFGDLLSLSAEQRSAAERRFEEYLDQFEPLRVQMIEVAVEYPGEGSDPADREFLRRVPGFVASVRELDAALFSDIEKLLTDTQRPALPRVRLLRERTLYVNLDATARFIGTNVPDLRELLEAIAPPDQIPEAARTLLDAYETQLTSGIRGVFESSIRLCTTDQPNAAEQLIERVRSLRSFNRKSCKELCGLIPTEHARRLKNAFDRRAYDRAAESTSTVFALPLVKAALVLPDITESDRHKLEQIRERAERSCDEIVDRLADLLDAEAIRIAGPQGAVGSQVLLDQFNAARKDLNLLDRQLRKEMKTLLGDARMELLKDARPDYLHARDRWGMRCGVVSYVSTPPPRQPGVSVPHWRVDPLHAPPITSVEMDDYIATLGLADAARDHARQLHQEYVKQLEEQLTPLRSSLMRQTAFEPREGRPEREPTERARAADQIRAQIRADVENADALLFEQVRAIAADCDPTVWEAIVRVRERARIMLDFPLRAERDPNRSAEIDIMRLLLRQARGTAFATTVQDIATRYESKFAELLRERFNAYAKHEFEQHARRDGWHDLHDPNLAQSHERAELLHKMHQEIARFNCEQLGACLEALQPGEAALLRDAFNKAAYPEAYSDAANMEPALRKALELADLKSEQRGTCGQLLAELTHAYELVRAQIIEASAAFPPDLPLVTKRLTPERTAALERFDQTFAKIADERSAINRAAMRGLRLALEPAQLRRLGLPAPE
jgi:hypothetical protein